MFNVILVDDEQIIRDGIQNAIDWTALDLQVAGTASNGAMALKLMEEMDVNIAVVDINIPIIDGLEVIRKAKQIAPDIEFIVLSGYDRFEYAQKAIELGVKKYLLKPIEIDEIINALHEIIEQLTLDKASRRMQLMLKENFEKVKPMVKQQFLNDLVYGINYDSEALNYYFDLLEIENQQVKCVMIHNINSLSIQNTVGIMDLAALFIGKSDLVVFNMLLKSGILFIIKPIQNHRLSDVLQIVLDKIATIIGSEVIISVSSEGILSGCNTLLYQTMDCLKSSYYLNQNIIFYDDLNIKSGKNSRDFKFNIENLLMEIRVGNTQESVELITNYIEELREVRLGTHYFKLLMMEILVKLAFNFDNGNVTEEINFLNSSDDIKKITVMIQDYVVGMANRFQEIIGNNSKELVYKIKRYVSENYSNKDLNVSYLGEKVFFLTADYVGKIFKNETGENLTQYILKERIDRSKALLSTGNMKVHIIANQCGFGDNSQHYSKAFKKVTGFSPLEYRIQSMRSH